MFAISDDVDKGKTDNILHIYYMRKIEAFRADQLLHEKMTIRV